MLTEEAKLEIRETVRDELSKLLDRGSEIQTTNDRLWLMRNAAHREIELLRDKIADQARCISYLEDRNRRINDTNADLYAQLDKLTQEIKADQAALVQAALVLARENLSDQWSFHETAYETVRARIRDI